VETTSMAAECVSPETFDTQALLRSPECTARADRTLSMLKRLLWREGGWLSFYVQPIQLADADRNYLDGIGDFYQCCELLLRAAGAERSAAGAASQEAPPQGEADAAGVRRLQPRRSQRSQQPTQKRRFNPGTGTESSR